MEVCANAGYLDCLDAIKPRIDAVLRSSPYFWQAVSEEPRFHLKLAKKLQLDDLFYDSARHLICHAGSGNLGGRSAGSTSDAWHATAQLLGMKEDDTRAMFLPQLEKLPKKIRKLEGELLKLCLHTTNYFYCERRTATSQFLDALRFRKPDRSEGKRADERAEYLARSHFNQVLVQRLHGEPARFNSVDNVRPKNDQE